MKSTIDANDFQQLLLKISNEGMFASIEADSQEEDTDTNYRDEGFSDVEVSSDESNNLDHGGEEEEMVSEPEPWIKLPIFVSMLLLYLLEYFDVH